ncbi:MAG: transmembrane anchor protein, partial [Hyphomonas sp.]|jgi:hypothetical protein|nr:transmembrane anchor protein [Hyphomonas sp.]MDP3457807.1 transmembrane anchor protein [Hyphomonas sp.]
MYNSDLPSRADLPSTKQLVRSTLIAAAVAAAILVTAVLPGEYGVDPTGMGRVLGLTQMGEIKQQLAAEAKADAVAAPVVAEAAPAEEAVPDTASSPPVAADAWREEVTLTLAPGEAAEIKLVMKSGETAGYAWTAKSGALNSDLHGDGKGGQATSYRKGRAEAADSGELTAAFDGSHGWFWRNRGDAPVELVLQVRGEYAELKRVV